MAEDNPGIEPVITGLFGIVSMMATLPVIQRVVTAVTPQQVGFGPLAYRGLADTRVLNVTPEVQWLNLLSNPPYVGWVSASFINDGPDSAFIGINNPDEMLEVTTGQGFDIDMVGAQRPIEFVFYKANPSQKAQVRVIGKY